MITWRHITSRRPATAWPEHGQPPALLDPVTLGPGRATPSLAAVATPEADPAGPPAPAAAAYDDNPAEADQPLERLLAPGVVVGLVMGLDAAPRLLTGSDLAELHDPLGRLLASGKSPLTLAALLEALDAETSIALPKQQAFLAGEAGQLPASPELTPDFRLVVTRGTSTETDLLVSTDASGDPKQVFLQVAGWDPDAEWFNYYMRIGPAWVWSGNSTHALAEPSRGQGCFDSHVNGSLVMKELKVPWVNWHSMKRSIPFAAGEAFRALPVAASLTGAETLEQIVRAGVSRWTAARLQRAVSADGTIEHPERLLRHLLTTTTINLTSSSTESAATVADPAAEIDLPLTFWEHNELLIDTLGIPLSEDIVPPTLNGMRYGEVLTRYDVALQQDRFRRPGDSFFAFVVPEPSVEDTEAVRQLLAAGRITPRFAACVLMIDFPNPVYSPHRAALLTHVPATLTPTATGDISAEVADRILAAPSASTPGTPEQAFAEHWALGDNWAGSFGDRLDDYLRQANQRIATPEGVDDYFHLAVSRRRQFATARLNEFALTLPATSVPADAPLLSMRPDATVGPARTP